MKAIITGFEPFGGESVNPSFEAVKLLPDSVAGCTIIKISLPVEYSRAAEVLIAEIDAARPDFVMMAGQAGGRTGITPEAIAINFADTSAADNAGTVHMGDKIIPHAPAAYFSTLPFIKMVNEMRARGVSAYLSNSAGAYVCNDLMFRTLHAVSQSGNAETIKCGFVHVPYADTQGKTPNMPLAEIARGLWTCVEACVSEYGK